MMYAYLTRPAFPVEGAFCSPFALPQHRAEEPERAEPKSLLRYVAMAALVVVPALAVFANHVENKVAPVASYLVQLHGGSSPVQMALKGE